MRKNEGGNMAAVVTHLPGTEFQKSRAFSPAVITEGGRTVWVAGQTATTDQNGKDIAYDFEAQVHAVFAQIDSILARCGGSVANLVTMTVFINDPRHGDTFVKMRGAKFPDGRFPASALITVSHFARPGIVLEIQSVAVI
jgi:2-iminobutanoate/2-iminopropanoate deaminase